jgi:anti-anti-sigma factor
MGDHEMFPEIDNGACDSLKIELRRVEGVANGLAFMLKGQVDTYSSLFFHRTGTKAIEAGFTNLIFLLEGVDYISSMGVGAFMQLQKAAKEKGGDIAMVNMQPKVTEIFELMCLESFFCCTDSLDEAIAPLKDAAGAPRFPRTLQCPACGKKLRAPRAGRFRCPACKTVVIVNESGSPSLAEDG